MLSSLLVLAACSGDSNAPPEKISGLWDLHQVELWALAVNEPAIRVY